MDIKELWPWDLRPEENIKEGCELKCPSCGEWATHTEWKESSVLCEECGDHAAIRCPACEEDFDNVHSAVFEVSN